MLALLLLVSVVLTSGWAVPIPRYECDGQGTTIYCYLEKIQLTTRDFHFIPVAESPSEILSIDVQHSTIPLLSSDVCDHFENLLYYYLTASKVELIEPTALVACTQLQLFVIKGNNAKLKVVDPQTFATLRHLEIFTIRDAGLTSLPEGVFDGFEKISALFLDDNEITEVPTSLFWKTPTLRQLNLENNDIFDLEIGDLVKTLPELSWFYLGNNYLSCNRIPGIVEVLHEKKVQIQATESLRTRTFGYQVVDGIQCLDDFAWNAMYEKHQTERIIEAIQK